VRATALCGTDGGSRRVCGLRSVIELYLERDSDR